MENGTYIKVYHTKSTAGDRQNSASGTRNIYGGGLENDKSYNSGSSDTGWVTMPDGSRKREQSSWSSSTFTDRSGNTNFDSSSTAIGTNNVSPKATETRLSSSSSRNKNKQTSTILNAAIGPGNYHGTMSKEELERDAGGRIFGSNNMETRKQVENTRYQGRGYSNGNAYQGSSNTATYEEGSYYDQGNREKYNSGGRSRTGQTSFATSTLESSDGEQNLFGNGYSASSSSSTSSSSRGSSNRSSPPKGQWVWDQSADGGKGKWEWSTTTTIEENTSSVTKTSGSQGGGYTSNDSKYTHTPSTGNINYNDRGYIIQPNGTITDTYSSWDDSSTYGNGRQRQNGRRSQYSRSSFREESSYGGVRLNSEDADEISKHFAHGKILDHNKDGNNAAVGHETGDIGKDSTGKYCIY